MEITVNTLLCAGAVGVCTGGGSGGNLHAKVVLLPDVEKLCKLNTYI